jgi:hypothetical protein
VACSGIISDSQFIIQRLFEEAQNYYSIYDSEIPVKRLVLSLSKLVHKNTMSTNIRPFGVRTCFISYDDVSKCSVLEVDCMGSCHDCYATSLGNEIRLNYVCTILP